jgi:hypothetical protein
MRSLIALLLSTIVAVWATSVSAAGKIRLAQSFTATNCMMVCNAQAANCQTTCLIPTAQLPNALSNSVTPPQNTLANTACISACSTTQLACQTNCARLSPTQ